MSHRSKETADFEARIEAMRERLARHGVRIVQKEYSAEAFGSWHLVAGNPAKQIDFSYDGKVSYLMFRDAAVTPKDYRDLQHKTFRTWEGEDPTAFVEDFLTHEFSKPGKNGEPEH